VPLSLGVALCLSEMAPDWLSHRLGFLVDFTGRDSSVVYGLWAVFVMGPWIRDYVEPPLGHYFGWLPVFPGAEGRGRDAIRGSYSRDYDHPRISRRSAHRRVSRRAAIRSAEAALALGATKWEMVKTRR